MGPTAPMGMATEVFTLPPIPRCKTKTKPTVNPWVPSTVSERWLVTHKQKQRIVVGLLLLARLAWLLTNLTLLIVNLKGIPLKTLQVFWHSVSLFSTPLRWALCEMCSFTDVEDVHGQSHEASLKRHKQNSSTQHLPG